jgi:hypothetical protein
VLAHSAILAAAEAEPSKVPFYIVGALLAVWAVTLASLGLTRPNFPYDVRGQRGVVLISLVLVLATLAMAVVTSK